MNKLDIFTPICKKNGFNLHLQFWRNRELFRKHKNTLSFNGKYVRPEIKSSKTVN